MPGGSGMFQPLGDTAKAAMLIACLAFRRIDRCVEEMVPAEGIEPPTSTLRKSCSTAELRRPEIVWLPVSS
jgi:hypothetical protein